MLDGSVRMLKLTNMSPDFSETPAIAAVISSCIDTLTELISSHKSHGGHASPAGAPMTSAASDYALDDGGGGDEENDSSTAVSADAGTVPEA